MRKDRIWLKYWGAPDLPSPCFYRPEYMLEILNYFSLLGNWTYSIHSTLDGAWGSVINPKNNSFNGIVGMVQRRVNIFFFHILKLSFNF